MVTVIARPGTDEYGSYYGGYIELVPDGDVLAILAGQIDTLESLLRGLSDEQANSAFRAGEWTIKEVVGHLVDAERIFAHRLYAISRADPHPLPGFEQDDYVREANYGARTLADLLDEWGHLRRANLLSYRYVTPAVSERRGVANEVVLSVRALVYILAGHTIYHFNDFREKYLPAVAG
jgi:uncharacterized damage-inducible protein DinB